jgi:hypothetical protein
MSKMYRALAFEVDIWHHALVLPELAARPTVAAQAGES